MKRAIALLLCLLIVFTLFAGCTKTEETKETATPAPTSNVISAVTTTSTDEESKEATVEINVDSSYRLCEPGEIELEYYYPMFTFCLAWIEDMNDNPIMKVMEQTTGVHIKWIHPNQDTASETYNLMFVSNDLPDIVKEMLSRYPGGVDAAIADGYYLDMVGKEEFFPNYLRTLQNNENFFKDAITDEGHYRGFGYLYNANARVNAGTGYRRDIFDDLGLSKPELISDWDHAFSVMKDAGYKEFVTIDNYGVDSYWTAAWETYGGWLNKYGVATYGPSMPEYKEYLLQAHDWYEKGYIINGVTLRSDDFIASTARGEVLVTSLQDATTGSTLRDNGSADDPDFYLAFAHAQRLTPDQIVHTHYGTGYYMHGTFVTTACEHPDVAMRWCDYFYTDEGLMLCQYGVEGITYDRDENGYPWLNEYITNNPDGVGVIWMLFINTFMGGIGIESLTPRYDLMPSIDEETKFFTESNFGKGKEDWNMPGSVSMTGEEGTEYTKIYSDIQTYVQEYTSNAIIGINDIESTWDGFQDQMERMGLSTAVKIYQQALNRYLARSTN